MLIRKVTALVLASVMLANCATAPGKEEGFCSRNTAVCIIGGVAIVAGVVAVVASAASKGAAAGAALSAGSDIRLKRDVRPFETLSNGLNLYSFRYWNDDRTFVSVMAQDLLEDERFKQAVIEDESGYYMVNLAALGLSIEGDVEQFLDAGRAAIAEAEPAMN